jgi:tyrosine-protein phosphatase SIW14
MRSSILLLTLALVSCQSQKPGPDIPNYTVVVPGIFRGGQPTEAGWAKLRKDGVTNVVKLNMVDEGSDNGAVHEGMMVHYFPLSFVAQTFGPVPQDKLTDALTNIVPGTYVHCLHGQDRTGLVIGLFRVRSGWTKAQAEKEMLARGFHRELHGLWDYWEDHVR